MRIQDHTATARVWLRHPWAILLAALAAVIAYEWISWLLWFVFFASVLMGHRFLGLVLGLGAIVAFSLRLGSMIELTGAPKYLRDRR